MNLRGAGSRVLRTLAHPGSFELTQALFLRLLGLIYLAAFGSFWPQMTGLVGSHGIVPAAPMLQAMHTQIGAKVFRYIPTLFWFGISDTALVWFCILGCAAALLLMLGFFPRTFAAVCWMLYLSLVSVGQPFSSFQWDALLLESGFLALFAGAPWLIWAYRFLLFRLMFESGAVKLLSHDPNWRNFHALRFHFMTQPLPNPFAYYVYRAPTWLLDSMTAGTLAVELVAPFLLFGPRRVRHIAAGLLMFVTGADPVDRKLCVLQPPRFGALSLGLRRRHLRPSRPLASQTAGSGAAPRPSHRSEHNFGCADRRSARFSLPACSLPDSCNRLHSRLP